MHIDQLPYAQLYEAILHYHGEDLFKDVLKPWLSQHQQKETTWIQSFGVASTEIPTAEVEDLWRLYAISRVSDTLLCCLPSVRDHPHANQGLPHVSLEQYVEFMESLGFSHISPSDFHPFFHEIVSVEQEEDSFAPIEVLEELWPSFILGSMMFSRAGCRVSGGTNHVVKKIAENSILYWSFRRQNRSTTDLSVGWGHNSQWRTSFRRDYHIGTSFFYNVDRTETIEENPTMPEFTLQERMELLQNRCFVRSDKDDHDLFPYELTQEDSSQQ